MDKEQKLQLKKIVKNPAMSWIFGVSGKLKLGVLLLVLLNSAISISAVVFALVLREAIDGAVSGNKMVFLNHTWTYYAWADCCERCNKILR